MRPERRGLRHPVWAAGDAISFPVKQGGLAAYLAELDEAEALGETPQPSGQPVELDLAREMPAAADVERAAERRARQRATVESGERGRGVRSVACARRCPVPRTI
jgi:hypothetical protein